MAALSGMVVVGCLIVGLLLVLAPLGIWSALSRIASIQEKILAEEKKQTKVLQAIADANTSGVEA